METTSLTNGRKEIGGHEEPSRAGAVSTSSSSGLIWPVLFFLVLTVIMTWPLVLDMGRSIVGQYGDNLYFIWLIGWFQRALFVLHQSPLSTSLLNFPEGWNLASTEMSLGMVLTGLPLAMVGGPTLGYNFALLTSFVVSGVTMYLWVARTTRNRWAALLAGTAFAYSPFRMSHYLVGHLNLLGIQWLPLFFMGLQETLEGPSRRAWRWGLVTAVSLSLIAASSQYLLYMSVVISAFVVLASCVKGLTPALRIAFPWTRILAWTLPALPVVLLISAPYFSAANAGDLPVRGVEAAARYSASPTDYLFPFSGHPLWGSWIAQRFNKSNWVEASLYVGFAIGLLAFVAFIMRNRSEVGPRTIWLHVGILMTAFVLSLGVSLHWLSRPVRVMLPPALQFLSADDGESLAMPARILYSYLPFYSSMRVPMRYGAFVQMAASFLGGIGAAHILGWLGPRWRPAATGILFAVVLLDFLPPSTKLTAVQGRPVDVWLSRQPDTGAVAQFPFDEADSEAQAYIYYTLVHHKPYIGSLSGSFQTRQYNRIKSVLEHFPDGESLSLLRRLGVRYVIVDALWYDSRDALDDVQVAMDQLGARLLAEVDGQLVYDPSP